MGLLPFLVPLLLSLLAGTLDVDDAVAGTRPRPAPRPGAVPLASAPPQTVELSLPFDGIWGVIQGFDEETHAGYATYALDFVPAERIGKGSPSPETRTRLSDFPCYGQPVLAPADGQVVWARDGAPDHRPHRQVDQDPGNFVIIQHAEAEYTELRHLQSGSVRVRLGDRVRRGQQVGRCGNSGNAKTPHLHVGLLGSVDPIATRPMAFSRYEVLGRDGRWRPGNGVPRSGEILRSRR